MRKLLAFLFLTLLLTVQVADAQRRSITYQDLLMRADQAGIYVDHMILPGTDGEALFTVAFRMDYDLLPFRRVRAGESVPDPELEYISITRMNLEVFRGHDRQRQREFESVARDSWTDTAWASTFEQTRSRHNHLEGVMSIDIEPGEYRYMLDLNRGESATESRSRERTFTVSDFREGDQGVLLIAESAVNSGNLHEIRLLNYGNNVLYGQNYQLILVLPETYESSEQLELSIHGLRSGSDTEIEGEPYFEMSFTVDDLIRSGGFTRDRGTRAPVLRFEELEDGYPVLITEIPNREYPNKRFRISVTTTGGDEPVASRNVDSRWIDMPVSLLNMDVAINKLRFIVDEQTLRELNRGSSADRERRFREFWAERDPTPETEFNELMAEYYRRIDFAYREFTTFERPGFESDQGLAYIQMGPPIRKERTFPTDGPTRELWIYNNQTLVFEATSGFGDYRLIGRQ